MSEAVQREVVFETALGRTVGLEWGKVDAEPLLCLHGWLDNAASFAPLAEYLQQHFRMIALDLPGHGHSDSLPEPMTYQLVDSVAWLHEILQQISPNKPMQVLAHSLGGVVATLFAGAFPDGLERLVLIDSLGPLSTKDEESPARLRAYVEATIRQRQVKKKFRLFSSVDEAHRQRLQYSVTPIKEAAARLIVERGVVEEGGKWTWRHDDKLKWPSPIRFSEGQIEAFLRAVTAPVLLVRADPGIGLMNPALRRRLAACQTAEIHDLPGTHHIHMDEPQQLAALIIPFLQK